MSGKKRREVAKILLMERREQIKRHLGNGIKESMITEGGPGPPKHSFPFVNNLSLRMIKIIVTKLQKSTRS